MRVLLPDGIDIVGLAMDSAVAAYLLDPSSGRYRLEDVVDAQLGVALDAGVEAEAAGQLDLDGDGRPADGADAGRRGRRWPSGLLVAPLREALEQRRARAAARRGRAAARPGAGPDGGGRDRRRRRRAAADHRRASWPSAHRLEAEIHEQAGETFNVNSTPQLRAVLYDTPRAHPGAQDEDGVLDRRPDARAAQGPAPGGRDAAALPGGGEAALHLRREPARRGGRRRADPRHLPARPWPAPGGCRRTGPTCTTSRCAPRRAGSCGGPSSRAGAPPPGGRLRPDRAAGHRPSVRRPGARRPPSPRGRTSTGPRPPGVFGVPPEEVTGAQRNRAKMVSYGLAYGMEAFGLAQRLSIETVRGAADPRRLLRRLPVGAGLHGADGGRGPLQGATPRRSSAGAGRCPTCTRPTATCAWRPSARP